MSVLLRLELFCSVITLGMKVVLDIFACMSISIHMGFLACPCYELQSLLITNCNYITIPVSNIYVSIMPDIFQAPSI